MAGNVDTTRRRLAGIEGVRAIAAMSVLVYHVYFYAAPDGRPVDLGPFTKIADNLRAGVTLFFVLSGFLLYRVFVAAALRSRTMPSVRQYLRNRALRILPAYWVILIGVALVFQHELLTQPRMFLANMLLLQNYFPSYLVGGEEGLGIVPAWSLVIEVSFYLLVPILGYVAIRLAARRGLAVTAALVPVGAMLAAGIAAKVVSRAMEPSDALDIWNHALPTHADWFAAGMALAVARVLHEDGRLHLRRAWVVVGTAGAGFFAVASAKLYYGGTISGLEQQTANAILFAVALGFIVLSPRSRAVHWLSWRPVVFIGLASYSLFLVHDPIVRGFRDWGLTVGGTGGFFVNLAVIGALSVALASLSYLYVERPALGRKREWQVGDRAGLGSSASPDGGASAASLALPTERMTPPSTVSSRP
jgi:peptidoglycan/LPS O-acetylase OafA/YrhL